MHSTRREEEENTYKRNVFNESAIINQEANKLLFNCLQELSEQDLLLSSLCLAENKEISRGGFILLLLLLLSVLPPSLAPFLFIFVRFIM